MVHQAIIVFKLKELEAQPNHFLYIMTILLEIHLFTASLMKIGKVELCEHMDLLRAVRTHGFECISSESAPTFTFNIININK